MKIYTVFAVLMLSAPTVQAGWSEADACASGLTGDSRLIYNKLRPAMVEGDPAGNKRTVRALVTAMASNGEISKLKARKNVKLASVCLKKAR